MGKHNCAHLHALVTSSHEDLAHATCFSASSVFSLWNFSRNLGNSGNKSIMSSTNVTDKRQQREMHRGPALRPYRWWAQSARGTPQHRSQAEEIKKLNLSWRGEQSTICLQPMTHSISLPPGQQCWETLLQAVFNAIFNMLSISFFF